MTEQWIVIPRWEEFQHRDSSRSKVPPWIKTWTRLLSDDDFLDLSHHLRGVLLGIWLEYARATRQLRGSTSTLSRRLGQRVTTRDLQALNHAGFIEFHASKPASNPAGTNARPDGDREGDPPTPVASRKNGTAPRQRGTNPRAEPTPTFACRIDNCPGVYPSQAKLDEHRELAHIAKATTRGPTGDDWLGT